MERVHGRNWSPEQGRDETRGGCLPCVGRRSRQALLWRPGWRLDLDYAVGDDFHVVRFTPPGSGCSTIFGENVTTAAPGSVQGPHLIVANVGAAGDELIRRGERRPDRRRVLPVCVDADRYDTRASYNMRTLRRRIAILGCGVPTAAAALRVSHMHVTEFFRASGLGRLARLDAHAHAHAPALAVFHTLVTRASYPVERPELFSVRILLQAF